MAIWLVITNKNWGEFDSSPQEMNAIIIVEKMTNEKKSHPFQIEKIESIPKVNANVKCGLYFVKMIECHSLRMQDMYKNDD